MSSADSAVSAFFRLASPQFLGELLAILIALAVALAIARAARAQRERAAALLPARQSSGLDRLV
ncbi:MAG: hypothetical protein ACRETS_04620, partial [Steroidobacteraceae bacterium]